MKKMTERSDSDVDYEDDSGELGQRYAKSLNRDISGAIPNFEWNNCANISIISGQNRNRGEDELYMMFDDAQRCFEIKCLLWR